MDTATNEDCEPLKLFEIFAPQDTRLDVRNIVAAAAKRSAKPAKVGLSLSYSSSFKDKTALEEAAATFA